MSLKKLLKTQKPLMTYELVGVGGCLMSEGKPLKIGLKAPKASVLIKNQTFTNIISKYTDVLDEVSRKGASKKIKQQLQRVGVVEQLTDFTQMVEFGKDTLKSNATTGWHDEEEKETILFVDTEEEEEGINNKDSEVTAIWVDRVSEAELAEICKIFVGIDSGQPLDIPLEPQDILSSDNEDGEILEVIEGGNSVSADKFRGIPQKIRNTPAQVRTGNKPTSE